MRRYIYIDPDDPWIGVIDIILTVDILCELLRCDATDVMEIFDNLVGYVDGEGSWQGRQTEWEIADKSVWGPVVIFKGNDYLGEPASCDENDLEQIIPKIKFF